MPSVTWCRRALESAVEELYDPAQATTSPVPTGSLDTLRAWAVSVRLPSGKVLIAGGTNGQELSDARLYDPAKGTFSNTGAMSVRRSNAAGLLLPDGRAFVVGGFNNPSMISTSELYH